MEYKTDKRTKNLTLRDIHVGDWVQVWRDTIKQHYPPMKIISIDDDGTVGLIIDEEQRFDPMLENIEDIDALPITEELLLGFGFTAKSGSEDTYSYFENSFTYNVRHKKLMLLNIGYFLVYFHEMQSILAKTYSGEFNFEWKGIEK